MLGIEMPPRAKEPSAETSFTGLPAELLELARAYAKRTDTAMRQLHDDVINALLDRIAAGENIAFRAALPGIGNKPYHARLSPETLDALKKVCAEQQVHKSIFFHRALRDYLAAQGEDVGDD